MKLFKNLLVFLLVFFSFCLSADAKETKWKKLKKVKDIQMYSKNVRNTKLKQYKAFTYIDLPMEFLFEVLLDINSYPEWYPDCLDAKLLKSFDKDHVEGNFIVYFFLDAQWPAANRDVVIRSESMHDWENGHVVITLKKDSFPYPLVENVQRMDQFEARYDFQYITRTRTRVIYTCFVDAGGRIPAALVNSLNNKLTSNTIIKLREKATDPKYKKKVMQDYF